MTITETGSATHWGPLWGSRPADWELSEVKQGPTYEAVIDRLGIGVGQEVLDVACGVGAFLRLAADRGARVSGLDASEELLALARVSVPEADLRQGDMEALPFEDAAFDAVTGFNSFFFAEDMVVALREAGRVAKPGAPVVIQVWGAPERCALEAMKLIARAFMPPPPPDAPAPPRLYEPGVLEAIAERAGLGAESSFDVAWAYEYADEDELGRAMLAPMGLGAVVGPDREPEVRAKIIAALAGHRRDDGSYRLENEFHVVVARA